MRSRYLHRTERQLDRNVDRYPGLCGERSASISCSENGEAVGACGAGCGNDQTLHIGSVPCTLCLFCPNGDCGASYNAGPAFSGEDPTTDKRAASPAINTLGRTGLSISFQYIENGAGINDGHGSGRQQRRWCYLDPARQSRKDQHLSERTRRLDSL